MESTSPERHDVVIVLTTLPTNADGAALAKVLVEEGLAACVNILPAMLSFYRWKGAIETDREQQLIMKTTAARVEALQARVVEVHPYELPEFLVLPAGGSDAYLGWIRESTQP